MCKAGTGGWGVALFCGQDPRCLPRPISANAGVSKASPALSFCHHLIIALVSKSQEPGPQPSQEKTDTPRKDRGKFFSAPGLPCWELPLLGEAVQAGKRAQPGGWFLTIPHGVGSSEQVSLRPPPPPDLARRGGGRGVGGQEREGSTWGAQAPRAPAAQRHSSTTSAESKSFRSSDGSSVVVSVFSVSDTEDTCRTQSLSLSGFG